MFGTFLLKVSLFFELLKSKFIKKEIDDDYEWWLDSGMPFVSQRELETNLFDVDERHEDIL